MLVQNWIIWKLIRRQITWKGWYDVKQTNQPTNQHQEILLSYHRGFGNRGKANFWFHMKWSLVSPNTECSAIYEKSRFPNKQKKKQVNY